MAKQVKRISAILLSILMIASTLSVGFTASAEETTVTPLTALNGDPVAIMDGETQIGEANYYKYDYKPANSQAFLDSLYTEGSSKLSLVAPTTTLHKKLADGSYKTSNSSANSGSDIFNNYLYDADKEKTTSIQNGDAGTQIVSADVGFNLEFADGKIAKQYGYDSEGCFYYDTAGEEKVRIEGATANDYETYTYILADNTKITDIVIGNHITPQLQASYIEFYASNDPNPDNLYSEDNLIAVYDKNNWISSNVIGASFSFTEGITASFVGMRVMDYLTGNRVGDQSGYAGVRMFKFDIYGVSTTALNSVYVAYETAQFSSVAPKTTVDDTTNYSIPKALYEKNSTFNINQVYYRNNYPYQVNSRGGTNLWTGVHDSNYQGAGNKTYKDSDGNPVRYEGCWTDVFYDFGDIYNINEIVYGAHNNIDLRAVDFTFYIGNDLLTLFDDANAIKSFKNSYGYISLQFGEGVSGRYVGVRFRDTAKSSDKYPANDYLRLSEINVFGSLKETVRDADVTNYKGNTALTALADTTGKASLVKEFPAIRRVNTKTGEVVNHTQTNKDIEKLFNNATATVNFTELAHVDENGKAADFGTYYTEIFYDLEKQEEITDILLVSSNGWNRAGFYDVFVSDDENIEASEK